jgi:CRP-like cAMP-binding protein
LAQVDLLAGLSEQELQLVAEAGTTFRHPPGQVVVQAGSPGPGLRLVLDGSAEVEVGGASRGRLGPGAYFGEISLMDNEPASATVTAGPDGLRTFALSPASFMQLMARHPQMSNVVIRALCARLRAAESAAPAAS